MGKSASSSLQIVAKKCKSYFKRKSDERRVNSAVALPPPADSLLRLNQSNTDTSSFYLPHEIIELILSKCSVKSVVRFKSVSKSWHSIVSDPRFSRTHRIQRSKLPENQNKFMLMAPQICLIRLEEDGIFQTESMLAYPSSIFDLPLCSCNGLILLGENRNNHYFVLWNPSIGKHIMITGPHTGLRPRLRHFYYDSTSDDHKIVFVYEKCYTEYSCKNGNWSEMKDLLFKIKVKSDFDRKCRIFPYSENLYMPCSNMLAP